MAPPHLRCHFPSPLPRDPRPGAGATVTVGRPSAVVDQEEPPDSDLGSHDPPTGPSADSPPDQPAREDLLRFHQEHYAATRKTRECRRHPLPVESGTLGEVDIHKTERGDVYFAGLQLCDNRLRCPMCATRRALEDGEEIQAALDAHLEDNGGAVLATFTLPHHRGDRLEKLLEVVQDSYRHALEGREWRELAEDLGYIGQLVKSREITVAPEGHGWHPHIHAILLFEQPLNEDDRSQVEEVLYARWTRRIQEKHGHKRPTKAHGVRVVSGEGAGSYVAKLGLGREVSSLALKQGRGEQHLTAFELLAHLYEQRDQPKGERDPLEPLWQEYVRATKGKHLLTWGRTDRVQELREAAEETPEDETETEPDKDKRIATLTRAAWRLVMNQPTGLQNLRLAAQRNGWAGVQEKILEYGRDSPWLEIEIDREERRIDVYGRPGGRWAWGSKHFR